MRSGRGVWGQWGKKSMGWMRWGWPGVVTESIGFGRDRGEWKSKKTAKVVNNWAPWSGQFVEIDNTAETLRALRQDVAINIPLGSPGWRKRKMEEWKGRCEWGAMGVSVERVQRQADSGQRQNAQEKGLWNIMEKKSPQFTEFLPLMVNSLDSAIFTDSSKLLMQYDSFEENQTIPLDHLHSQPS